MQVKIILFLRFSKESEIDLPILIVSINVMPMIPAAHDMIISPPVSGIRGANYHIMCRGNHRHDIYRDDEDRQVYLTLLREPKKEYNFYLHSYSRMTNHVHLHIETADINISIIMKRINLLYAQYFNNKYNFVGHLFQDCFKSELIETDQYHLEIGKYIHLNPVRANMTELPIDYTCAREKSPIRSTFLGVRPQHKGTLFLSLIHISEPT